MKKAKIILLVGFIGLLIGAFINKSYLNFTELTQLINDAGIWAPIVFFIIYVLLTIVLFPVTLLTLAAGVLFGPYWGTLYALVSATVGASCSFLIARYFAYELVQQRSPKMVKKLIAGVEREGWQFIAFTRLVPIFPFVLINYAFGLTQIRTATYTLTNFVFMLPGCFAYTYLGFLGQSAASDDLKTLISHIFITIAIFASLYFFSKILRRRFRNSGKLD